MIDMLIGLIPETSTILRKSAEFVPGMINMLYDQIEKQYASKLAEGETLLLTFPRHEGFVYLAVCASSSDLFRNRVIYHGLLSDVINSIPPETIDHLKAELIAAAQSGEFSL